jgi:hypothetical protein
MNAILFYLALQALTISLKEASYRFQIKGFPHVRTCKYVPLFLARQANFGFKLDCLYHNSTVPIPEIRGEKEGRGGGGENHPVLMIRMQ